MHFPARAASGIQKGRAVDDDLLVNGYTVVSVPGALVTELAIPSQWSTNSANVVTATSPVGSAQHEFLAPHYFRLVATPRPKVEIAVAANRDETIHFASQDSTDQTSSTNAFRFWCNDDHDLVSPTDPAGGDSAYRLADSNDNLIATKRDLEDFARLEIKADNQVKTLVQQGYKLAIETTGGLAVNVYRSPSRGTGYLTDQTVATSILGSTKYRVAVDPNNLGAAIAPADYGDTPIPFLFEGKTAGEGTIKLVLKDPGGNPVPGASSEVHVKLQNIKEMYERATLDDGTTEPLSLVNSNDPQNNIVPTDPNEAHQIIVFIHGWNMTQWEWQIFSETMFKRLWHQGYKGRFATLRWPTKTGPFSYNTSEEIAFKSGLGTSRYFNTLKSRFSSYSLNVAAHSMGNMVMGEALRKQIEGGFSTVHNYVAMQGAVPARCYDVNAPTLQMLTDKEQIKPTPNTYHNYLGNIHSAVAGSIVNFYNAFDFALVTGVTTVPGTTVGVDTNWQENEKAYKPDTGLGYDTDGVNSWWKPLPISQETVTDPYTIMAFVARPRSRAVGAEGATGGAVNANSAVDLMGNFNFGDQRSDHSGQFNRNIQLLNEFYQVLKDTLTAN